MKTLGAARHRRVMLLFDALRRSPTGLDIHQIGRVLGLDVSHSAGPGRLKAFGTIRDLRLLCGAANEDPDNQLHGWTIPIRRESRRQVYFLTANREAGSSWQGIRADTVLSRLEVDLAHWRSVEASTDGRTMDGRIARACVRNMSRLIEDVRSIREDWAA